ncbi:TRAP transporter small permease [Virgibacillus sp. W0430]|uniref:TRAP transporter small permease n=1 Tax=Virgibacillus sp. W0430 TaxID=3391580 RepID=UPI003F460369
MNQLISKLSSLINIVLGVILSVMLVITFIQVVLRYVFNSPLVWAEEITLILLVWYGYLVIAILIRSKEHIALEFLYSKLGRKLQKGLDVVKYILLFLFAVLMVYYGFEMMINAQGKSFPVSRLPRSIINLPMMISGLLILLYTVQHLVALIKPVRMEGDVKSD